jgi:hypothetical protein
VPPEFPLCAFSVAPLENAGALFCACVIASLLPNLPFEDSLPMVRPEF